MDGQFLQFLVMSTVQNGVPKEEGKKAEGFQPPSFKGKRGTMSPLHIPFLNVFEDIERWEWNGMKRDREGKPKHPPRLSKLKAGKWHPRGAAS